MCGFILLFCVNLLPKAEQRSGFSLLCIIMCVFKVRLCLKFVPQRKQLRCFSPVFLFTEQEDGFSPASDLSWLRRTSLAEVLRSPPSPLHFLQSQVQWSGKRRAALLTGWLYISSWISVPLLSIGEILKLLSILIGPESLLLLFNVWRLWLPLVQTQLKHHFLKHLPGTFILCWFFFSGPCGQKP